MAPQLLSLEYVRIAILMPHVSVLAYALSYEEKQTIVEDLLAHVPTN